ncbi:MAG: glycerol-3-phosphate dehydrogenase/oxidase, partial [Acidimicrobiia bacterium]|nr:glycerol-3-phosphate dehydrogenase/oxidase [Acidimicrobiia bacterium]
MDDRLDARCRSDAIRTLADTGGTRAPLDVLVVGGGITGAGVAVDAASRGLDVGIVEMGDWASGTSSRSSNLVHGGLRYLRMFDFRLVWEALGERELLLQTTAPHLVRPQPFLFPLRHRFWQRWVIGAGVALYDLMATIRRGKRTMPMHRHLSRRSLVRRLPSIRRSRFIGAIEYWDATIDDVAMVIALIRTAVGHGATAVSRVKVVGVTLDDTGRVNGVTACDLLTGTEFAILARNVIVAAGVWTEDAETVLGDRRPLRLRMSKGVHISVDRGCIDGDAAIIHQTEDSVLFLIPSRDIWVIGTTDTPWDAGAGGAVRADRSDVDYLIAAANEILDRPITRGDVRSVWAGLRPLLRGGLQADGTPSRVSREHTVASVVPGVTAVAGGKLTTYRVMAEDTVDLVLGSRARSLPSVTNRVVVVGSDGLGDPQHTADQVIREHGWDTHVADRLSRRFGSRLKEIDDLCTEEPDLAKPLSDAPEHVRAEVIHAVLFEGALSLEDVMWRRMRISRELPDLGSSAAGEVAELLGRCLGWDEAERRTKVRQYLSSIPSELGCLGPDSVEDPSNEQGAM